MTDEPYLTRLTTRLLDGVERLPPGAWRLFTPQGERGGEYWAPPAGPDATDARPLPEVLDRCQARTDRGVRLNLRSDVPVGIFLSGGVASYLLAETAARQGRLNRAYCLDFSEKRHSE